ncbi:MAG: UDP-N-acetylmuramate--L-alanine ligase [Saprospiraceae bacterium]|nr:UDP-N-acetylmuramate--L-alanine ligase [Saprospiraceae bacterium]
MAHILYDTGVPLTALLGGIASNYNNNFLQTGEDWFVLEADEYDRSFLHLTPDIAAIGSLDADHLDIYGDRTSMVRSYLQFASQVKEEGVLLLSDTIAVEDIISAKQSVSSNVRVEIFGLNNFENSCVVVEHSEGKVRFHYTENSQVVIPNLQMRLPGEHNIRNAIAAIRISRILKIAPEKISKALANFSGIYRRFEILLRSSNAVLIDDYAHHPEELKSAIHTCKLAYKGRKVTGIFQPHLYSRTKDFLNEFAEVLDGLDQIILVELYPARELPIEGISSQSIYDKLKNKKKYLTTKKELLELLKTLETDVVLMMGAGDLDVMREQIKKTIEEKQ